MKIFFYFTIITFLVCTFIPDPYTVSETKNFLTDMNQLFEWHFKNLDGYYFTFNWNENKCLADTINSYKNWSEKSESKESFNDFFSKLNIYQIDEDETKKIIGNITNQILKKYTYEENMLNNLATKIINALFNSYINTRNQIYENFRIKCKKEFQTENVPKESIDIKKINYQRNSIDMYKIVLDLINRPIIIEDFVMINPIHECMPLGDKREKEINMVDLNLKRCRLFEIKDEKITVFEKLKIIIMGSMESINATKKAIINLKELLFKEDTHENEETKKKLENTVLNFKKQIANYKNPELKLPENEISMLQLNPDICRFNNEYIGICLDFSKVNKTILESTEKYNFIIKNKEKTEISYENLKKEINKEFKIFNEELIIIQFEYEFITNKFIDTIYDKLKSDNLYIKNVKIKVDLHHFNQLDKFLNHIVINNNCLYEKYGIFDKFYNENNTILDEKTFLEHYGSKTLKLHDQKRLLDLFSEILIYFEQFECKTEALEKIYNNMNSQIEKIKKHLEDFEAKIKPNYKIVTGFVYIDILESFDQLVLTLQTINDFLLKEYNTSEEDKGVKEKINQNQTDLITLKKNIDEMKNKYPKNNTETNSGSNNNTPKPEVSKATENNNKDNEGFSTKQIVLFVAGCLFLIGLIVFAVIKMRIYVRK